MTLTQNARSSFVVARPSQLTMQVRRHILLIGTMIGLVAHEARAVHAGFMRPNLNPADSTLTLCVGDALSYAPAENDVSAFAIKAREGIRLFLAGEYQSAIDVLTAAIALEPNNALAYYHRGIAYQRLKAYPQALSDFTVVIDKGAPIDFAYLNRGAVRTKLGLMLEAESDFDAALKMEPTRPDTYFNRALLFLKTNRGQQAIDDITKGIGFNPKDAKAYFLRASALETFHRHSEARHDLDEALRLDPDLAPARELLKRLDHD